jgi:hypothetical protein
MTRAWNTPLFVVATAYFVIDGIFSYITRPLTAWLSRKKLFERLRRWATSLGPYQSFALLAVPFVMLEPAKPLGGYLLGTGHFFLGAIVFVTAEVLKLTVVERLFQLNKRKLLWIPAFAWGYGYWRRMMDFLESTNAWRTARRVAIKAADWVRGLRSNLRLYDKNWRILLRGDGGNNGCPVHLTKGAGLRHRVCSPNSWQR